jgi:AmmeMemoRadiSam system protein B
MSAPIRHPAVAGQFYPAKPEALRRELDRFLVAAAAPSTVPASASAASPGVAATPRAEKIRALGCVVPHAGYMYSGHVAGAVYARLEVPRRFIMLCPNHTGAGEPLAIMSAGSWLTPLGEAAIDTELAEQLKREFPSLREDAGAHAREHALEVQIPFLQQLTPEFRFVPIAVGTGRLEVLAELGESIARVLRAWPGREVLVIASSDMNHYEDDARTRVKDRMAIDKMLALDPAGLWETVQREQISMCGFGPAVAMLRCARELGATGAELVKYATSGDVSGDRSWVVGYAGIVVS